MVKTAIVDLFHSLSLGKMIEVQSIAESGSPRQYFRIITAGASYIGTYGDNIAENQCFVYLSGVFARQGLPVPEVLGISADARMYIQTDCGSTCLLDEVLSPDQPRQLTMDRYRQALLHLISFQLKGGANVDFTKCLTYPRFSDRLIFADLSYFKYYFLKLTGLFADEYQLDADCYQLAQDLQHTGQPYFMYRDFQARNIMVNRGQLAYIDFQGGMNGPLQYDLAALLYQARAGLSRAERDQLYEFYVDALSQHIPVDRTEFTERFYLILLVRVLQTLGAYGFRGFIERKQHFIQSIAPALANLRELQPQLGALSRYPHLQRAVQIITLPQNIEAICQKIH